MENLDGDLSPCDIADRKRGSLSMFGNMFYLARVVLSGLFRQRADGVDCDFGKN